MDITVHVTITLDSSRQPQSFRNNAYSLSIEIGGSSLENCQKLLKIYQQYLQNSYTQFLSQSYILQPTYFVQVLKYEGNYVLGLFQSKE